MITNQFGIVNPKHRLSKSSTLSRKRRSRDRVNFQQSLARLRTAFGDGAPCAKTIYIWFAEFKRSLVNFCEYRDGRPSIAVNNKNIDYVRRTMETDQRVTYYEI
ncbi:hypothetical protein EVAR_14610_1 [Eumeta japonica]|uniref:Mos1 transposase HTH domain-containing protein n=1 Tax=Eumeta variegata TaxID=151549 RepID=A0A4C1UUD9_EUMVA|nr:hypothetical protein EVAR_14610_1 [Eumeta japonica]